MKTIGLKQDDPLQGAELPIPHALFVENQTTGCFPGLKGNAEELTSVGLVVAPNEIFCCCCQGRLHSGRMREHNIAIETTRARAKLRIRFPIR